MPDKNDTSSGEESPAGTRGNQRGTLAPSKVLFVHTPKAGGSNLIEYFDHRVGYRRLQSRRANERGVWLDYRADDLRALVNEPDGFLSTHSLSFGWSRLVSAIPEIAPNETLSLLRSFRQNGWFTFTFVRHPGELLTSFYHYILDLHARGYTDAVDLHVPAVEVSLDDFVAAHCDTPLLPAFWRDLDYCAVMTDDVLPAFLASHFGHDYRPVPEWRHASGSQGYHHYCSIGEISPATQRRVRESENMAVYREITTSQRPLNVD